MFFFRRKSGERGGMAGGGAAARDALATLETKMRGFEGCLGAAFAAFLGGGAGLGERARRPERKMGLAERVEEGMGAGLSAAPLTVHVTTNLKKPVPGQSRQRTLGGSKSGDESWHREPPPAARTGAACQSLVCMRRRRRTRRRRRRSFRRYNWIPFYSGFRGQKSPHESKKSWRI